MLRQAQHERKVLYDFNTKPVHSEPVEACPELDEGGFIQLLNYRTFE